MSACPLPYLCLVVVGLERHVEDHNSHVTVVEGVSRPIDHLGGQRAGRQGWVRHRGVATFVSLLQPKYEVQHDTLGVPKSSLTYPASALNRSSGTYCSRIPSEYYFGRVYMLLVCTVHPVSSWEEGQGTTTHVPARSYTTVEAMSVSHRCPHSMRCCLAKTLVCIRVCHLRDWQKKYPFATALTRGEYNSVGVPGWPCLFLLYGDDGIVPRRRLALRLSVRRPHNVSRGLVLKILNLYRRRCEGDIILCNEQEM